MDISDINKLATRKRIYTDAEKLREKVTQETAKIIKLKVAQDTAYWDLKEKLQQLQESHERLQQNMIDVQMQYEDVSGQYQDELRLRPETLNKLSCTREICDVLEEYGERVRRSLERCRADQRELGAAYGECGARVKRLIAEGAVARDRERELRETVRVSYERHDADVRRFASAQEQLGAARARVDELVQRLERCEIELRQREEAAASIQTKVALLMRDFESKIDEQRHTIATQEKQIQETQALVETERVAKNASDERTREVEGLARAAEERARITDENIARLHHELGAALEQARNIRAQYDEANGFIVQLKNEVKTLHNELHDKEKMITEKNQQLEGLQRELANMKLSVSGVENDKLELVSQLQQVMTQNQVQANKVEELTRLVATLEASLEKIQITYDTRRTADAAKIEELTKSVAERDAELNTKTGTINKLMNDLKAAANASDTVRKQYDAERQTTAANITRLESILRDKESQIEAHMRLIQDLRRENELLRADKERLNDRINDMQATIDNIQKLAVRGPPAPPGHAPAERDVSASTRPRDTAPYDFFSDDSDAVNAREVKRRFQAMVRGDHTGNVTLAQMKKDLNLKNRIFKNKRQEHKLKKNKE